MVRVSASDSTLFDGGRGLPLPLLTQKNGKDPENLKKALVFQLLFEVIVLSSKQGFFKEKFRSAHNKGVVLLCRIQPWLQMGLIPIELSNIDGYN